MIDWHIGYTGPWNDPQPQGGVAPFRADLELARHLEKRAAYAAAERLHDGIDAEGVRAGDGVRAGCGQAARHGSGLRPATRYSTKPRPA